MATKKTAGGSRATAKKAPAKKSAAKKSTTKSAAKKTTAKRSPAKRSSGTAAAEERTRRSTSSAASDGQEGRKRSSAPRAAAAKKRSGMQIGREAAQQLLELTGREAEGVTGLERTDDGWRVEVEVVEVRRIPDTTDVLALYEITVDEDGDLEGYRRLRRYSRGAAGQERER
jgi:hypothetical protein